MVQLSTIADRVRRARQAAGLTQQDLAYRARISQRTLSYIEAGEDTRLSTLTAIADALNVPLTDLVGNDDEPDTIGAA